MNQQERRATEMERRLLRQLAANLGMGAALGAGFALWLLLSDAHGISSAIAGSEAPTIMRLIFVVGLAAHFGFCAALTAFLMLVSDD
jgi:uncharacterized membrane protein